MAPDAEPPDPTEEPAFVERLRRRDEAAFNQLVRRWEGPIYQLVLRMVGDRSEAEELSQEVFVTVFKAIDGFRGDAKLSTWLYRIAVNHCKNRIKYLGRRAHRRHDALDEERDGPAETGPLPTHGNVPGPEAAAVGRQSEALIQRALGSLDAEHRTLVVLRDVQGLTYEAIQDVTGLAEGTVKSRLHRARLALQHRYEALVAGEAVPPGPGGRTTSR